MKKLIQITLLSILMLFAAGCTKQPNPASQVDPELPKVNEIKTIQDVDSIGFEWESILHSNIQGYIIYRSNPNKNDSKLDELVKINDKFSNHYVDTKLQPNTKYSYRFAVYSNEGTRGQPGETITVQTVPMIDSVSFIKAIQTLPRRAKIIWRPHGARNVQAYVIQRKIPGNDWEDIATVEGRLSAEYIDSELDDNSIYHYRVKVKLYNGLLSKPSKVVTTKTKPLPPTVYNVIATNDQPKKIILEWNPVEMEDFAYYKVYRKKFWWSYHVKTDKNSFIDEFDDNGVSRDYKVTVVDKDGLESLDSVTVKGTTLPEPNAPKIATLRLEGNGVYIQWYPNDERTKQYILLKDGDVIINGTTDTKYHDSNVLAGQTYEYSVYAVDEYGLTSDESQEAEISIPNPASE